MKPLKVFSKAVRAYRLDFAQGLHNYSKIFASQTLWESNNAYFILNKFLMHRNFYLLVLLFAFLAWNAPFVTNQNVFSQSYSEQDEKEAKAEKERQKFVKKMQALLDAAQKSGFSEKQIREISVTRDGKLVHVWDFLEQEKLRQKKEALAKKKFVQRERYLTVMDIADELESSETRELDALKDRSIFMGAEEK